MRKRRTHQGGSDPGRSRLDPEAAAAHMLRRLGATLTSEKRTSEASACGGRPEEGGHQWGGGEEERRFGDTSAAPRLHVARGRRRRHVADWGWPFWRRP
jgi:hypothetical protein